MARGGDGHEIADELFRVLDGAFHRCTTGGMRIRNNEVCNRGRGDAVKEPKGGGNDRKKDRSDRKNDRKKVVNIGKGKDIKKKKVVAEVENEDWREEEGVYYDDEGNCYNFDGNLLDSDYDEDEGKDGEGSSVNNPIDLDKLRKREKELEKKQKRNNESKNKEIGYRAQKMLREELIVWGRKCGDRG